MSIQPDSHKHGWLRTHLHAPQGRSNGSMERFDVQSVQHVELAGDDVLNSDNGEGGRVLLT